MANNPQQPDERTEREFALDVNQAVANTEMEIFDEALGDDPLDNDGDTSLEEMGEGLEGDDLDEEEEEEQPQQAAPEQQAQEEEEAEEEPAEEAQPPEQERPEPRIPPARLREEAEARRRFEQENSDLRRQLAEMNGRLTEISARQNTPPPKVEQQPEPDMFADPEGWKRYQREDLSRQAQEIARREVQAYQQQQEQFFQNNAMRSFQQATQKEDGWYFRAGYDKLSSLDKNDPLVFATAESIVRSPNPARALQEWWDENGGREYREQLANQLLGDRRPRQQAQPRHETRLPPSMRSPPSLNSVPGGQRQQTTDPEMLDDSDEATFRFATRR